MNEAHTHKIGVVAKDGCFGCECGKRFSYSDAMIYVEREKGDEEGRKYWVALRMFRDEMRRDKRKGVKFEGIWYPGGS